MSPELSSEAGRTQHLKGCRTQHCQLLSKSCLSKHYQLLSKACRTQHSQLPSQTGIAALKCQNAERLLIAIKALKGQLSVFTILCTLHIDVIPISSDGVVIQKIEKNKVLASRDISTSFLIPLKFVF